MMEKKEKTWTEPKLTALVRRKPEEGVLQLCKGAGVAAGSDGMWDGCRNLFTCISKCSDTGVS